MRIELFNMDSTNPKKTISKKINKITKGAENKEERTETLSSLLKQFDIFYPNIEYLTNETNNWITQAKLKTNWPEAQMALNLDSSKMKKKTLKSAETLALSSATLLERVIQDLEQRLEKIEREKDKAKEFARNCFVYLNKIHKGTCLGEAGIIMLNLFDNGDLSGNIIFGLVDRAETISVEKDLPFANKLTTPQANAITFMLEEKDTRLAPTIENLQAFLHLYKTASTYGPLLKALTCENFKEAQKLLDAMD